MRQSWRSFSASFTHHFVFLRGVRTDQRPLDVQLAHVLRRRSVRTLQGFLLSLCQL